MMAGFVVKNGLLKNRIEVMNDDDLEENVPVDCIFIESSLSFGLAKLVVTSEGLMIEQKTETELQAEIDAERARLATLQP